jgi:glycosyltransferase involved in cell wall biosynthesis
MSNITACILSFNRPAYLCEAVASVLAQTKAPKDIIIFDNGSESDVLKAVTSYLRMGVRWVGVATPKPLNWRPNFRRAVAEVRSEYVFIMHDDDKLCSDFIEKQIEFMEANPGVVAVTCNAYLIDENGKRNGRILRPDFIDAKAELYRCSVDIALKYASDSCIPLSPTVYRTEFVRKIEFREEFEKVSDAVFFCDMADIGSVAYQSDRLYECRIHPGQDSSYISPDLIGKLEKFLWTRRSKNNQDIALLHKQLIKQHTSRSLRLILVELKVPVSLQNLFGELHKTRDEMFSYSAALNLFYHAIKKFLTKKIK